MLFYKLLQGQRYCGRLNKDPLPPKDVHILISRTFKYVARPGKRDLVDGLR